jgi:hypothetical protein
MSPVGAKDLRLAAELSVTSGVNKKTKEHSKLNTNITNKSQLMK